MENSVRPKGKDDEFFDFSEENEFPIAVNFDEDINILFELNLGDSALGQLDSNDLAGEELRITAEAYVGGRVDNTGTPTEFFYTETFDADDWLIT